MNLTRLVAMFVGLLFLNGILAGTASATTVVECRMLIAQLRNSTVDAQRQAGQTKDQSGSLAKLDDISLMLAEGKNAEAIQRLDDFVAQGYPSIGVQDVIGCINAIGAS
jgi:hypothetical protein